ncbi:uncharacterized protein [Leptinotarsa decemlineata]|uniref:uncharacterized protein n=1 Tax=Leptinotarsa decemlineata TaxID=7539 RepID=UPI003D309C6F
MEEKAKEDFVNILSKTERHFQILHTKWQSDMKTFEAKFRTQIPPDNEDHNFLCDEWVNLFSRITDTVWAMKISNTGPKIRFRKQYQCWTGGGTLVKKELLFDPTRCKGTLDIKVLADNTYSKRTNRQRKLGLNIVVKMNFHHLHEVDTTPPFSFFVHHCLPQQTPPQRPIKPNERLPELVAAMVQSGPSVSRKTAARANEIIGRLDNQNKPNQFVINYEENILQTVAHTDSSNVEETEPDLGQSTTFQNMEPVKFDVLGTYDKCTQFVLNPMNNVSQLDAGEQFLMYPLVFEVPQIVTISTQSLPPQFVHILPKSENDNQNLM